MNYLELCQRAMRECHIAGRLTTTVNQSGELQRLVEWVSNAYDDICARHDSWRFLRSAATVNTVINQQAYEVSDWSDTRVNAVEVGFARWWPQTFRIYRLSAGVATETFLPFMPYNYFRDTYLRGNLPASQPSCFTVRPDDDAIVFGPKPEAVYVINSEYQIEASSLNDDDDEPLFAPRFHMAIVRLAGQSVADFEQDGGMRQAMLSAFNLIMGDLERDQLPAIMLAGPLA